MAAEGALEAADRLADRSPDAHRPAGCHRQHEEEPLGRWLNRRSRRRAQASGRRAHLPPVTRVQTPLLPPGALTNQLLHALVRQPEQLAGVAKPEVQLVDELPGRLPHGVRGGRSLLLGTQAGRAATLERLRGHDSEAGSPRRARPRPRRRPRGTAPREAAVSPGRACVRAYGSRARPRHARAIDAQRPARTRRCTDPCSPEPSSTDTRLEVALDRPQRA